MPTILLLILSLLGAESRTIDACRLDSIPARENLHWLECILPTGDTLNASTIDQDPTNDWVYYILSADSVEQGLLTWKSSESVTLTPCAWRKMLRTDWEDATEYDTNIPPCGDLDTVALDTLAILQVCTFGDHDTLQLELDTYGTLYTMTRTDPNGYRTLEMGSLVVGADGRNIYDVSDWCDRGTWQFGQTPRVQTSLPSLPIVQLATRNTPTEPDRATTCYLDLSCP